MGGGQARLGCALMLTRRLKTVAVAVALWSAWGLCVLLILPVLLNVPGKAEPWEIALYLAVLAAVVTYPVLLPVLTVLERWARHRSEYRAVAAIHAMTWIAFCGVLVVLTMLGCAFYAHERARPVLTREERFTNAYANAILWHDTAWMDRLLSEGASVDHPLSFGQTPAVTAAAFGDWSLVVFLLKRGADPDRRDDGGDSVRTLAANPRAVSKEPAEARALDDVRALLRER